MNSGDTLDLKMFSRSAVIDDLLTDIECEDMVEVFANRIEKWIADYEAGAIPNYQSKTDRINVVKAIDSSELAVSLILSAMMIGDNTLQALCSHYASSFEKFFETKLEALKTATEIVCYCDGGIYDIHKPSIKNEHAMYTVTTKFQPSAEILTRISRCFFLPPSVERLDPWTKNNNGGYDFARKNAVLGDKFNRHHKPLNLHVLNVLQDVRYELVNEIVDTPEEAKGEWTDETIKAFELAQEQARYVYDLYKGKPFSFIWQYDKRGRVYSSGYDINVQGNSYRKAMLQFAKKEKLTERGIYWLKIDIANCYGLDKESWDDRIKFVNENISDMLENTQVWLDRADEPLLLKRALLAYEAGVIRDEPIGHICQLDATASGPQLMSVVARDPKGMRALNVIGSDSRHDFYTEATEYIHNKMPDSDLWKGVTNFKDIRSNIKGILMTSFYNSKAKPEEFFGKDTPELKNYYEALSEFLPGAWKLMHDLNSLWADDRDTNEWVLPDGHTAFCPVTKLNNKRIEVDEMKGGKAKIKFLVKEHTANKDEYRSLCVNIIHSLDAWVCRTIIQNLADNGIEVSPIHDSFGVHPNYCDELRRVYKGCLARLYREDIVSDIASQVVGEPVEIERQEFDSNVYSEIMSNLDGYYIC